MFIVHDFTPHLPADAVLSKPIENDFNLLTCELDNFDREGYEFLPIEQEYYKINGYDLFSKKVFAKESGNVSGWNSLIYPWVERTKVYKTVIDGPELYIDHSYCLQAFKYTGEAYDQIKKMSKYRPELIKLLNSKIKYGTDLCIDYIEGDDVFEVLHIEWDFNEFEYWDFIDHLNKCKRLIEKTNWLAKAKQMKNKFKEVHLEDEAIADIKAMTFGLDKAFRLRKRL